MQDKDEKPKRGRKTVAAAPAAKAAPADSKKTSATKKPAATKKAEPVKDNSEDDKASKIAQALFGDESAASAELKDKTEEMVSKTNKVIAIRNLAKNPFSMLNLTAPLHPKVY